MEDIVANLATKVSVSWLTFWEPPSASSAAPFFPQTFLPLSSFPSSPSRTTLSISLTLLRSSSPSSCIIRHRLFIPPSFVAAPPPLLRRRRATPSPSRRLSPSLPRASTTPPTYTHFLSPLFSGRDPPSYAGRRRSSSATVATSPPALLAVATPLSSFVATSSPHRNPRAETHFSLSFDLRPQPHAVPSPPLLSSPQPRTAILVAPPTETQPVALRLCCICFPEGF